MLTHLLTGEKKEKEQTSVQRAMKSIGKLKSGPELSPTLGLLPSLELSPSLDLTSRSLNKPRAFLR